MIPAFLSSRLKGDAPLETVFWRDMLAVGSILNVASTAAALALFSDGQSPGLALLVNFAPVPWNVVLLVAVWKAAERNGGPSATTANVVAALWFIAMLAL